MSNPTAFSPVRAIIGFGSNLGDSHQYIRSAASSLDAHPECQILAKSSLYRSAPVGPVPDQPDFLNSVALIATSLSPLQLLDLCQAIELAAARERTVFQGPRTLDLDLLDFEGQEVNLPPRLIAPHPRAHQRAFVLVPLAEILPRWILRGRSASDWLSDLGPLSVQRLDLPW
ncbi:MAG: 2-amino-4-hydroxy-6-hydroxymethyldihydropteridine diphosphokinase [Puniceicoccaceae bacterium]